MLDTTTILCIVVVALLLFMASRRGMGSTSGLTVSPDGSLASSPLLGTISAGAGLRTLSRRTDGYGGDVVAPFLASQQPPSDCGCSSGGSAGAAAEGLSLSRASKKKAGVKPARLGTNMEAKLNAALAGH